MEHYPPASEPYSVFFKQSPVPLISRAIHQLKEARDDLRLAGADKAADYVARALKSAEGAARHARNLENQEDALRAIPPQITDEATREAACKSAERAFYKLMRKLIRQHHLLTIIGENDMGLLHRRYASRFHTVIRNLEFLISDLTQDVAWPHPPGTASGNWGRQKKG